MNEYNKLENNNICSADELLNKICLQRNIDVKNKTKNLILDNNLKAGFKEDNNIIKKQIDKNLISKRKKCHDESMCSEYSDEEILNKFQN